MRHVYRGRSRGSVVLTVTAVGLFAMLLASGLVNHYAVTEARAVEESLAKVRVYWAAMGHVNYALSRAWREGFCDDSCLLDIADTIDDTFRVVKIGTFLGELDGDPGTTQRDRGGVQSQRPTD